MSVKCIPPKNSFLQSQWVYYRSIYLFSLFLIQNNDCWYYLIKIKLISFKSSEHIFEKGDGPYRLDEPVLTCIYDQLNRLISFICEAAEIPVYYMAMFL